MQSLFNRVSKLPYFLSFRKTYEVCDRGWPSFCKKFPGVTLILGSSCPAVCAYVEIKALITAPPHPRPKLSPQGSVSGRLKSPPGEKALETGGCRAEVSPCLLGARMCRRAALSGAGPLCAVCRGVCGGGVSVSGPPHAHGELGEQSSECLTCLEDSLSPHGGFCAVKVRNGKSECLA